MVLPMLMPAYILAASCVAVLPISSLMGFGSWVKVTVARVAALMASTTSPVRASLPVLAE